MSMIVDRALDTCLGARVRTEREARGWSLTDLAGHSGVSRAMIHKIERGESSPTAALLGKLSGAFGITLSELLARAERTARGGRLLRSAEQGTWQDPETGYLRRQVAPVPGSTLPLELVHVELPAGAAVRFPAAAYSFFQQLVWVLKGRLTLVDGTVTHELGAGDCLELGSPVERAFRNTTRSPCEYLVAVLRS
jgi:transcriptional regulator with XRE-family HTH domain